MTRSEEHPWLNRFAWLTAGATFLLVGLGGLVTSKGAGMAVPDWPTTYGYNMFLFPIHLWTGGIFYEHTHRLLASTVGLLTVTLATWLWMGESRRWLRWLGLGAVFAVVLQGVLGGLRVTLYKDELGIFHALLGQSFFVLLTLIAFFVSGAGQEWVARVKKSGASTGLRRLIVAATALIFAQLILGATMRHQHAGLAVPDFPLAYGRLWPRTDGPFIERINEQRMDARDFKPITAFQIQLHMAHRLTAFAILVLVSLVAWTSRREQERDSALRRGSWVWLGLIAVQALLGAATVWSNKAADVATAHVLLGALSLLAGVLLSTVVWAARRPVPAPVLRPAQRSTPGFGNPAIARQPNPS